MAEVSDDRARVEALTRRRVLIVDDNVRVRQELRTLLPLAGDVEIVGEAANGREAIRLARALRPEVVLIDLEMPVLDGYEVGDTVPVGSPIIRLKVQGEGNVKGGDAQSPAQGETGKENTPTPDPSPQGGGEAAACQIPLPLEGRG